MIILIVKRDLKLKVAVVVSTYKQEKYIEECLDSILNQKVNFDFKVFVADDFSPDSTLRLIKNKQLEYPDKIVVLERTKNLGVAENYLDAHKKADGDIVFHFDGDDVMMPGKLQEQYNVFQQYPDVNFVMHGAEYFSDDGLYCSPTGIPKALNKNLFFFDASELGLWGTIGVHSSYAFRQKMRKQLDIKTEFTEWFFAMDSMLPEGRGVFINQILVKYRANPNSGSYLSTRKGKEKAYQIFFNDIERYFKSYKHLHKHLYANYSITLIAMMRNRISPRISNLKFIFLNLHLISISNLIVVFRYRLAFAPKLKNR